jgi:hypothetical protein
MARGGNPFYYGGGNEALGAALGKTLGTALFGDPEAAAKLALQRAQMDNYAASAEEARKHGGLYDAQTAQQQQQTQGSRSMADTIAALAQPPAPIGPVDPLAPLPEAGPTPDAIKAALPAMIAGMVLAQGDKVNASSLAQLPAYFGDDEMTRRSLIATGHTPGEDFALTPERADDIRSQGYDAALTKALSVENIQSADRRRGQDINSSDTRRGQDLQHQDRLRGQDVSAGAKGGAVALDGFNPGGINDGAWAKAQPGYVGSNGRYAAFKDLASGEAAQKRLLASYIARGYDTPQKIADRWAPAKDGNDPVAYAQTIARQLGIGVNDRLTVDSVDQLQFAQARAENAAYRGKGKSAAKAAAPKAINATTQKMLDDELEKQIEASGLNFTPGAKANVRASVANDFQRTGNAVESVMSVLGKVRQNLERRNSGGGKAVASSGQPPVKGARKAPDGNWYVQTGRRADGSPQYARVDG